MRQRNTAGSMLALPTEVPVTKTRFTALACLVLPAVAAAAGATPPDDSRRGELVRLVRQDCGSCHGLSLQGGLGPALTPAALRDKPADSLKATILNGRPGTPMPPWSRFMSEAEADWVIARLLQGFPDEHAKRP